MPLMMWLGLRRLKSPSLTAKKAVLGGYSLWMDRPKASRAVAGREGGLLLTRGASLAGGSPNVSHRSKSKVPCPWMDERVLVWPCWV